MVDSNSFEKVLASAAGQTVRQYRASQRKHAVLQEKAEAFLDLPISQWPPLRVQWDLRRKSQQYTVDEPNRRKFWEWHPKGFLLGYVDTQELDAVLHELFRRDAESLWASGDRRKLAGVLVHLSEGRRLSPPLVHPCEPDYAVLQGGVHRYAVAKAIGESRIPIYVEPCRRETVHRLIDVQWKI